MLATNELVHQHSELDALSGKAALNPVEEIYVFESEHCMDDFLYVEYQNMSFPTHVWQRIEQRFCKINEMCRKFCPILHISHIMKSEFLSSGTKA